MLRALYRKFFGRLARKKNIKLIDRSGVFDGSWYTQTYPDVPPATALLHYMTFGAKEGRNPSPLFDTNWYLATYPDVAASGVNPLVHFVGWGIAEGRDPSPLFDTKWYLATYPDAAASGMNPLAHYVKWGVEQGQDPNPLFDTKWYLATYGDVAASGMNPLAHYVKWGVEQGRDPNPLFDTKWYLATYPDVVASGVNPLAHFVGRGIAEGRFPSPLFVGHRHSSQQHNSRLTMARYTELVRGGNALLREFALARRARLFDEDHYRTQYQLPPDGDALSHFLLIGEREGATPFRIYYRNFVAANLNAAPFPAGDSLYFSFVDFRLTQFDDRIKRDVLARQPTWVTPFRMGLDSLDGVFLRTFAISVRLGEVAMVWPIDADMATRIVVPIIAPDTCLRSISLPVDGQPSADCSISFSLAIAPTDAPLIDGRAQYDAETSSLVWKVRAGVLDRGRRYFLRVHADRPTGLELSARSFDAAAFMTRRVERIVFDLDTALPCDWRPGRIGAKRLVTVLASSENLSRSEPLVAAVQGLFPGGQVSVLDAARSDLDAFDLLRRSRTVLFDQAALKDRTLGMSALDLVRILRIHGTELALLEDDAPVVSTGSGQRQPTINPLAASSAQELPRLRVDTRRVGASGDPARDLPAVSLPEPLGANEGVGEPNLPHVAVVTVLYRKADNVKPFLEAIYRQSYPGKITVVFVDDCSPGESFEEVNKHIESTFDRKPPHVFIQTVRNAENLGNCLSRNAGIAACEADIYVLIDADCLMNGDFVRAHVSEHLLGGADAVIGPYNIESNLEPGHDMLRRLEANGSEVLARANMQDSLLSTALVNTITRNLSIRKQWFDAHSGFDPALSYSAKPDSGFGWEDVDIGARIYAANGIIRFTPHAFSIHLTHPPSLAQAAQARGSAKNFRYLLEKHAFIGTVSRRWCIDTADRIVNWARVVNTTSPDIEALDGMLTSLKLAIAPLLPYLRKEKRRYRILTHRWHVAHQYEIYKLPFDFTLVTGTGTGMTDQWSSDQRPLLPNVRMVRAEDVDPADFDMAILHFDENVLSPDLGNGILSPDWGDTFRWFLNHVKLPMAAVCHGTVPFAGQYGANPGPIEKFEIYEADADRLRHALADVPVVVNSHQAGHEWHFNKMRVIWHGLDPQEFLPGPHDLDVVSHGVDPARPHYRGAHELQAVLARLGGEFTVSAHKHASPNPVPNGDRRYSEFAFRNWLNHLGRHKVYLNTTLRSPMPRSRTEAMLCGVIPVSLDNHDVSRFIENGVNGFYGSSVEELADYCRAICSNPAMQERMSAAARATAADVFNHDRFLTEWVQLVEETIGVR